MVDQKMCRLCMDKENLTSIWGRADGEKISEKIYFVCGIKATTADSLPKFVCHQCLSFVIIGSNFKKKSLETEKFLRDQLEVEIIHETNDTNEIEDDPFFTETKETLRSKYLVYEENSDDDDQPKISYNISDATIKIKSTKQFENAEMKSFVDGYLAAKPNLEIIKVVNPESIKEIEKVVDANVTRKRSRNDQSESYHRQNRQKPSSQMIQHPKLLSALAGQRFGNVNINRISSPLFNYQDNSNYRNN